MSHGLTREQFDAAELRVRRELGRCDLGTQKLAVLDYFLNRSFPLQRVAAFFKNFRQLGRDTGLKQHVHGPFDWLREKGILLALPHTRTRFHWYGISTTFPWSGVARLPDPADIGEQDEFRFDPDLAELLRYNFVENLSAAGAGEIRVATELSVRDAGPEMVPQSDIEAARTKNPAPSFISTQPEAGTPATQGESSGENPPVQKNWRADWQRMKREIFGNFTELPATPVVPEKGTAVPFSGTTDAGALYPVPVCTQKGYSKIPNVDRGKSDVVPEKGTSILAGPAVPAKKASPSRASVLRNWKPAITGKEATAQTAFEWIQAIDFSEGLRDPKYAEQWRKLCEEDPAYVLDALPGVLLRQIEPISRPLALLAHVARKDGRMR
jgi:hypothetical protein